MIQKLGIHSRYMLGIRRLGAFYPASQWCVLYAPSKHFIKYGRQVSRMALGTKADASRGNVNMAE